MIPPSSPSSDFEVFTSFRSDGLLLSHQDSQFYMLSFHRDRLLAAQNAFHWPVTKFSGSSGLLDLEQRLQEHLLATYGESLYPNPLKVRFLAPGSPIVAYYIYTKAKEYKIRILISPTTEILINSTSVPTLPLSTFFPATLTTTPSAPPTWSIYLSPHPTTPTLHTTHKTTLRAPYDDARSLLPLASLPFPSFLALTPELLLHNPTSEITEGTLTTPYFFRSGTWLTPPALSGGNQGTTRRWALEKGFCVEGVVRREEVMAGEVVWLSNGVRGWGWGRVGML